MPEMGFYGQMLRILWREHVCKEEVLWKIGPRRKQCNPKNSFIFWDALRNQ